MKKIIISNKSHTLFFFTQAENSVFMTTEEDRAFSFKTKQEALDCIRMEVHPYQKWIHEYKDDSLQPEEMVVSSYEYTTTWEDL